MRNNNTSPGKAPVRPRPLSKPGKPDKHPDDPADSAANPAETEGGVRSPLDGKFEADHRPSR